jgi:CRP/FNR family transcriptional regulator, cyclic AMP receptor protein
MNSSTEAKQPVSEYQANLEILVQLPLFAGLPLEPLKVLAYLCRRETYKPGEIIFHEHEVDPCAYYFLEGKAALITESNGEAEYTEFGERDFIGAMSLFCDLKRLFTLKAQTKVVCLALSREKFQKVVERFPEISGRMVQAIFTGVHAWEERLLREHAAGCDHCRKWIGVSLV